MVVRAPTEVTLLGYRTTLCDRFLLVGRVAVRSSHRRKSENSLAGGKTILGDRGVRGPLGRVGLLGYLPLHLGKSLDKHWPAKGCLGEGGVR